MRIDIAEHRITTSAASIALISSMLLTGVSFVASLDHWWPDLRQAVFLALTLLSVALVAVWAARLPALHVFSVLTILAVVAGSTFLLEWRSAGPDLFCTAWIIVVPGLAAILLIMRWHRSGRWGQSVAEGDARFKSEGLTRALYAATALALLLAASKYLPIYNRGVTPMFLTILSLAAAVSSEVLLAPRLHVLGVLGLLAVIPSCAVGIFLWGVRATNTFHAGYSPVIYAAMYTLVYLLFVAGLCPCLLAVRLAEARLADAQNPADEIQRPGCSAPNGQTHQPDEASER